MKNTENRRFFLEDLECLNEILKTGIAIENALALLETKKNKDLIERIVLSLKNGMSIESIISDFLPAGIKLTLTSLMKLLPFSKALNLSLSFFKEEKAYENFLLKNASYPLILLFISLGGLFLFDRFGMDSIILMVRNITDDIQSYEIIRICIRVFVTVSFSIFLIAGMTVLYFSNRKRQFLMYSFLAEKVEGVRLFFTNKFIGLMLLANQNGCSSKEALALIRSLKEQPILSAMAFRMEDGLLGGESLVEASVGQLFDPLLSRYLKISSNSLDNRKILENYKEIAEKKMEKKLKKFSLAIQLCTYLLIGVVIVFIYQILFMPLQAISQF